MPAQIMIDVESIQSEARCEGFKRYLEGLLLELCRVDTTAKSDVAAYRKSEEEAFEVVERHLGEIGWEGLRVWREPIDPTIEGHRYYSRPYYTKGDGRETELSARETYEGRSNLLAAIGGTGDHPEQGGLALNVHVDVVRPYIPPRLEGDRVYGRGACDDKGPLASLVGALKLVRRALEGSGMTLKKPLTAMFVIEEETGGNGSLSLALNRELKHRYDTVMVLEVSSNRIHPGNRGAVWYKIDGALPGANLFEASAFIVEEMEREGNAIRAESRHDLFPHRPVQTCHGILGPFGEHPSRICGRIDFEIRFQGATGEGTEPLIRDLIEEGLRQYIGCYGDKTKVMDPSSGRPKVERHYDLIRSGNGFSVQVHGSTGHMGSILQNDGAITKMAAFVRALVASRSAIERAAGATMELALSRWEDASRLVMEGGQGFLPTHGLEEIQERMRGAVHRGAERFLRMAGLDADVSHQISVSYDKLHNAAFAGATDSPAMQDAIASAKEAGMWDGGPVLGWDVSCDSRLFATEYPDMTVLTSGPGHLIHAHADDEQIEMSEVVKFAEFLALFILRHLGVVWRRSSTSNPMGEKT